MTYEDWCKKVGIIQDSESREAWDYQQKRIDELNEERDKLLERDAWLCALEAAGVDNWDGWDFAKETLAEWEAESP